MITLVRIIKLDFNFSKNVSLVKEAMKNERKEIRNKPIIIEKITFLAPNRKGKIGKKTARK
jgi:hypothetical protein